MPSIRAKQFKLIVVIMMISTSFVIYLYSDMGPDLYFVHWQPLQDTSCHYLRPDDDLPSSESEKFYPSERSIFFHETSCRGGLNSRQACAVEAAARKHPQWDVHVLFSAPVPKKALKQGTLAELVKFGNIKFSRLYVIDYAKGTPVEDMVADGALNRTRWRVSHTSDILRYLTLYKWGGVYLDLDTVCARPLDGLAANWAARENERNVAAGAMAFSRNWLGRHVAMAAMSELEYNFRGDIWGYNGPGVITRVLKRLCSTDDVAAMRGDKCRGFEVYGPQLFYPISWPDAEEYVAENGELKYGNPYIYHVWNKFTESMQVHNTSLYAQIAQKYCPLIYSTFKNRF